LVILTNKRSNTVNNVYFLQADPDGKLVLCQPGYVDAQAARKDFSNLEPGNYHLASFLELDITVEPPQMPTTNVVTRGTVVRTRKPTTNKKTKKTKKDSGGEPNEPAA
jgi:hypothetical protein